MFDCYFYLCTYTCTCNYIVYFFFPLAWKNGWQIISPKKSFAVYAASPTEKAEWMAHINKCIADLLAQSGFNTHYIVWCILFKLNYSFRLHVHTCIPLSVLMLF